MKDADPTDVSGLLAAWSDGDERALNRLVEMVYPSLRRIAQVHIGRRRGDESLESATLANEAYLKLARAGGIRCQDRTHFLALCSQVMRRILVDHARRRRSAKRGGTALSVTLHDALAAAEGRGIEMLALHEALEALSRIDPRKGRVVELRYFGGLNLGETAEVLGVSVETVKRDWRMARAWLLADLAGRAAPALPGVLDGEREGRVTRPRAGRRGGSGT